MCRISDESLRELLPIELKYLIIICGPTAVGKTGVAVEIAKELETEILSADARQFYKELNVGTATPSEKELKDVVHHFVNFISIHDEYNAGKYEKDALECLKNIFKEKDTAVMVGGSGLFIKSVCQGFDKYPEIDYEIRNDLNKTYESKGIQPLQERLQQLDPGYYEDVDLANPRRVIRALEVCIGTGKPFSSFQTHTPRKRDFIPVSIGLNMERGALYERINERVDRMMEAGLLQEVKSLHLHKALNALASVGYKELIEYLDGEIDLDAAVDLIKRNSRRYAKRQITWFGKDKSIKWFPPDEIDGIMKYLGGLGLIRS